MENCEVARPIYLLLAYLIANTHIYNGDCNVSMPVHIVFVVFAAFVVAHYLQYRN